MLYMFKTFVSLLSGHASSSADLKLQQCWLCCRADTLNTAAFIVNGTAERGTATTEYKNGHSVQKQHRG